jgi:hypothetical protein
MMELLTNEWLMKYSRINLEGLWRDMLITC